MPAARWEWTHRYAVPLFVASLIGFLLSSGALVTVVLLERDGDRPGLGGAPSGERCLVGRWQVVEYWQEVPVPLLGSGRLDLAGAGPVYEFRPDGTGRVDYGDGVRYATSSLGEGVPVVVSGSIDFRYQASADMFQMTEVTSHAQATVSLFGPIAWELATDPVAYTCAGDRAVFSRTGYQETYQRLSD